MAAHAINLTNIKVGESAVVVGTGMVGAFLVQLLKISGVCPVIAVDIDNNKLKLAKEFGADFTLNPNEVNLNKRITSLTKDRGADFGFEVVGFTETVQTCLHNIRKGGTAVFIGNLSPEIQFPLQRVVTNEIKVLGSCAINGEYEMVIDLLASKQISVDKMISAVAPLSEGAEWFKRLYSGEENLNKVILVP